MAKRLKNSSNTLLNYFSPSTKNSNNENSINKANLRNEYETPKKSQDKRPAQPDSDDEEVVQVNKRRKRRLLESPDSSDAEQRADSTSPERQSTNKEESQITTDKIKKRLDQLPARTPSDRNKRSPSPVPENSTTWAHENIDFLKPANIRDAQRHRPSDPEYDARTIHVPSDFLSRQTPAMRQWWEIKSHHFDCVLFFKVGKFYELYHMDAVTGVNELALSFMKGDFAHSGFPEIAYGRFSNSLVELGYKVARVEQTETPDMLAVRLASTPSHKPTKFDKVVRREVCQLTNRATRIPGVQDGILRNAQSDHLCALLERRDGSKREFAVCFVDTSVGLFQLGQFADDEQGSRLLTMFSEYPPATVLEERHNLHVDTKALLKSSLGNCKFEPFTAGREFYTAEKTIETLEHETYFKSADGTGEIDWPATLQEMIYEGDMRASAGGRPEYRLALRCLGAVIHYLKACLLDVQLLSLRRVEAYSPAVATRRQHMVLDAGALHNLHILGQQHSLQSLLDRCGSAGGKRLLRQWICRPLCDPIRIAERQRSISELAAQPELLRELTALLNKMPDLEREIAKIHTLGNYVRSRTHPDSRAILYEQDKYCKKKINDFMLTLEAFRKCCTIATSCSDLESDLIVRYSRKEPQGIFPDIDETLDYFTHSFDHAEAKKLGKIIPRPGVDEDYDDTVEKLEDLKKFGEKYLKEQEKYFGCKLNYFGRDKKRFQLEVPESAAMKKVNDSYQLEGTKKGSKPCKRYSTAISRKLLADTLATEKSNTEIVHDLNRKIFEKFSSKYDMWTNVCECISTIDCLTSLALYATSQSVEMCVPEVIGSGENDEPMYEVEEGVHPFAPHLEDFIPNSIQLGCSERPPLMIITGANMGGKTTLMRQAALHAIMAQVGSWVPARRARLSVVDRVFTRLGARDDIMAGRSTFHVELREALAVLKHATTRSMVLLDELGRGTSTHDGSAIAAAYVRDLAQLCCRAVFSTHYRAVMSRFENDQEVQLCHMACKVESTQAEPTEAATPPDDRLETVTFLYRLGDGACPRSYGFNAARLAGLPRNIIARGQHVSRAIETDTLARKLFVRLFKEDDDIVSALTCLRSLQL